MFEDTGERKKDTIISFPSAIRFLRNKIALKRQCFTIDTHLMSEFYVKTHHLQIFNYLLIRTYLNQKEVYPF